MSIHSLLIPVDGSPLSASVVEAIVPMLGDRTEVTLLHVDDGEAWDDGVIAQSEAALRDRGCRVSRRDVRHDDPAGAILDVAAELSPDLVVMSTHGRSGVSRWVRGSVAERVLRGCPVPLLMVNPRTHGTSRLESVLVAIDGSEVAERVLDPLLPIARAFGARLTLLYVDFADPTDTPTGASKRRAARSQDVAEWLAGARARVEEAGLEVEICRAEGDVAHEIVEQASPDRFDLLAMSTHGRHGPGRWLLGSIAEKVLRECRLPVFLVRTGGRAERDAG